MLKSVRQAKIRTYVEENGQAEVAKLINILNVSEATIRRDLEELAQQGWLRRTHGGAVRVERARREPPIFQRQTKAIEAKQRIGKLAAQYIQAGETIFLGSGTTVHEVARNLHGIPNLTIITNALNVVNELAECENVELIVIGGMFRQSEASMVGHIAENAIREFRADRVFMGMRAIDPKHGFTNDYLPEAMTDRAILEIAPQRIVVADSRKLGRVSTVFLAPITAVNIIITDVNAPPEIVEEFRTMGLDVQLA
ncbi:MAG: DeoR/GlpR transcriptional regulator [Anaerolineaceae bacterium]|nr:DeoR/GlpR transcriptional regulator [Anaerolineaceae bacterium]